MQEPVRTEIGDVLDRPVTFSGPSGRRMESPMPFTSRVVFITVDMRQLLRPAAAPAVSVIAASIFV